MSIPGQFGRGGLRELFIGTTPSDLVEQLTDPNYHGKNFPRDSQDKGPTTAPLSPVSRATTKTHQYQHYMLGPDVPANEAIQRGSRAPLAAGESHYFRANFQPDYWEIYLWKGAVSTVGDAAFFQTGVEHPTVPYDVLMVTDGVSEIRVVPGRGMTLALWAYAGNAGNIYAVVKAISSLASGASGAVDE